MESLDPKWFDSDFFQYGVNSLWFGGLHIHFSFEFLKALV